MCVKILTIVMLSKSRDCYLYSDDAYSFYDFDQFIVIISNWRQLVTDPGRDQFSIEIPSEYHQFGTISFSGGSPDLEILPITLSVILQIWVLPRILCDGVGGDITTTVSKVRKPL